MRNKKSKFRHPMGTYRRNLFFDSLDGELDVLWKNGFVSEQVGCNLHKINLIVNINF